jgi:hypothetical protein
MLRQNWLGSFVEVRTCGLASVQQSATKSDLRRSRSDVKFFFVGGPLPRSLSRDGGFGDGVSTDAEDVNRVPGDWTSLRTEGHDDTPSGPPGHRDIVSPN